uniref:Putative secreted protein n=1 Tax=Anopheles darlingi TaxID=43151 RepID=A0A2M4DPP8_ANODA
MNIPCASFAELFAFLFSCLACVALPEDTFYNSKKGFGGIRSAPFASLPLFVRDVLDMLSQAPIFHLSSS